MMKKLLFVGTAVLAISATALQAETVTNQGVTYDVALTNSSSSTTTGSLKSKVRSYDYSNYKLILNATREDIKNVTETYTATATATTLASVTFDSWTSDPVTTAGEPEIITSNAEIDTDVTDIFTSRFPELKSYSELVAIENQVNDEEAFEYFYSGVTKKTRNKDGMMQKISNYADILYYVEEEEGEYTVYALSLYEERINTTVTTKTASSYNVTTIPAGVITANVKSLTIGSNITSIDNNAFENATGITYVDAEGVYIDVDNTYLYTADKTTLRFIGKNYASEALEVIYPTTAIGSYATVGFENNQVIYYNSTTTTLNTTGQAAVFVDKNPHIDWISTSNSDIYVAAATSYVDYSVLDSELSRLTNTTSCVDLRNVVLAGDISLRVNYGNIMVILPNDQGFTVGGTNVIYLGDNGYVCDKLVLSDNYNTKAFYSPLSFTAAEANYNRVFTSNNSTVCLPFSFTVPNTLTVATMANSNSEGVIFAEVTETQAGKPYLIFSNSDNATIPTMNNVSVSATPSSNKIGEYEMIGVYEPTTLSAADGNFYGFSSNSLVKITGTATANVKLFRAYLSVEGGSAATMRVSIEAENETNAIEDLETINDDDAAVYNLNGQKIDSKAAGFQILSNGTKRIIK